MGANSKIEWCGATVNFWWGCDKISEGCEHCYAATFAAFVAKRVFGAPVAWGQNKPRQQRLQQADMEARKLNAQVTKQRVCDGEVWAHAGTVETAGKPETKRITAARAGVPVKKRTEGDYREFEPAEWEALPRPRPRVFVNSMSDIWDARVPVEWLHSALHTMFMCQNLDFLLLSKRPQNWRERIERCLVLEQGGDPIADYHDYFEKHDGAMPHTCFGHWLNDWTGDNPPENVWVGTTVENQARAEERIPQLLSIPAKVRFLSCEPLLGPVDLERVVVRGPQGEGRAGRQGMPYNALRGEAYHEAGVTPDPVAGRVHWVIAGGESGPGARPMHMDWPRGLRDQCQTAGVPFFFKQWGEWTPENDDFGEVATFAADASELPADWRARTKRYCCLTREGERAIGRTADLPGTFMKCVGKAKAGRLLDGREWNEFPKVG